MDSKNVWRDEALEDYTALNREIESYWDVRSSAFSKVRLRELAGPSRVAWQGFLAERLPKDRPLRVLDVGTGAGFFAILLAGMGHQVTGIDMSGDMLHEAKQNAMASGVSVKFQKMDAQVLSFADDSFDVVISRNLTWTLPDVMAAYREWQRVLKPGGLLMNFDSDYGLETFSQKEDQANVHAGIDRAMVDTCNAIKDAVRISTHRRPAWDAAYLQGLDMAVEVEADIADIVHNDPAMQYDSVPLFAILARK